MAGNKFPVLVYSLHFGFKARDTFNDFIAAVEVIPSLSPPVGKSLFHTVCFWRRSCEIKIAISRIMIMHWIRVGENFS